MYEYMCIYVEYMSASAHVHVLAFTYYVYP